MPIVSWAACNTPCYTSSAFILSSWKSIDNQKSKAFPCNFISFISLWFAGQIYLPCKYKNTLTWWLCQLMQKFRIETGSLRWARRCGLLTNMCIHLYSAHHMELEKYWMMELCEKPELLDDVLVAVLFLMKMLNLKPLFLLLGFRCCSSSDPSPRPGDFFRRSRQQQHTGTDSATSGWNPHFLQGKPKFMDNI